MSNPPSATAAMGPPSAAAARSAFAAQSAGPLGQTQAQGLKRAFEGMSPIPCLLSTSMLACDYSFVP